MASVPTENEQVPSSTAPQSEEAHPVPAEAKVATKKDTSLKEFLSKMDDYAPIVSAPDLFPHSLFLSTCNLTVYFPPQRSQTP